MTRWNEAYFFKRRSMLHSIWVITRFWKTKSSNNIAKYKKSLTVRITVGLF
ncbi:hypothetical protein [Paenibacillus sp. GCM10028914]|uniref:hypothetical protein n=1 Tax=Paenibacillus sp. GCM10028914 TaxID=3273416 RepID=UPI00362219A3